MKSYYIHDNGINPYKVMVKDENIVEIYEIIDLDNKNDTHKYCKKPILQYEPARIFIPSSANGKFKGNSILLQINDNKYIFIGKEIYSFRSLEPITYYVSNVGYNDVPYPYAIDKSNNVYLMIEFVILTNRPSINWYLMDPYIYYYNNKNNNVNKIIGGDFYIGDKEQRFSYDPDPDNQYNRLRKTNIKGKRYILKIVSGNIIGVLDREEYCSLMRKIGKINNFLPLKTTMIKERFGFS